VHSQPRVKAWVGDGTAVAHPLPSLAASLVEDAPIGACAREALWEAFAPRSATLGTSRMHSSFVQPKVGAYSWRLGGYLAQGAVVIALAPQRTVWAIGIAGATDLSPKPNQVQVHGEVRARRADLLHQIVRLISVHLGIAQP